MGCYIRRTLFPVITIQFPFIPVRIPSLPSNMNMLRISEAILIIVVLCVMDIAQAMKSSGRDSEIVMIPTPGHPSNPPPSGSSSTNQADPDEILADVFNQIRSNANKPLSTFRDHLRLDRRIRNGNALRMELVDRCAVVSRTLQTEIQSYLVLACRFLTGYVSIPSLTISSTNTEIRPDDIRIICGIFDYLFRHKETIFRAKLRYGKSKIPDQHKAYIFNKCQQIVGNTADRMVWQVVGCDFIILLNVSKEFSEKTTRR